MECMVVMSMAISEIYEVSISVYFVCEDQMNQPLTVIFGQVVTDKSSRKISIRYSWQGLFLTISIEISRFILALTNLQCLDNTQICSREECRVTRTSRPRSTC
jgi:hypothetical protein